MTPGGFAVYDEGMDSICTKRKCIICRRMFEIHSSHKRTYCYDELCRPFYDNKVRMLKRHSTRVLKKKDRKYISVEDWINILIRFDHQCAYCPSKLDLSLDHVVPMSRGGKHTVGNIVPACRRCNGSKGDMLLSEWRYMQGLPIYQQTLRMPEHRKLLRSIRRDTPQGTSPQFVLV